MTHLPAHDGLRMHICFDSKTQFPVKLYEVANDDYLIKWNEDGTSILVEEQDFEDRVMICYPGFVQIPTFLNFRRLFREYSFEWRIVEGTDTLFEFSHSCFLRDSPNLLSGVRTKRKSLYRPVHCSRKRGQRTVATASPGKPVLRRRYRRRRQNSNIRHSFDQLASSGSEYGDDMSFSSSCTGVSAYSQSFPDDAYSARACSSGQSGSSCMGSADYHSNSDCGVAKEDLNAVLAVYAMNELTDEEYLQLIANKATDCDIGTTQAVYGAGETTPQVSELSPARSEEFVPLDYYYPPGTGENWYYGHANNYNDYVSPDDVTTREDKVSVVWESDVLDLDPAQTCYSAQQMDDAWYTRALDITNLAPTLPFSSTMEATDSQWTI